MTYETIITIICVVLAITVLTVSFRFAHWRNRAEEAEAKAAHYKHTEQQAHMRSVYERFDASPMTFFGANTVIDLLLEPTGIAYLAFKKAAASGELTMMLNECDHKATTDTEQKQRVYPAHFTSRVW